MDSQLYLRLPFEIIAVVLEYSKNREICSFRETCKKFQRYIDRFIHPYIISASVQFAQAFFGVLDSFSNSIFVSSLYNHTIQKIDLSTSAITTLCGHLTECGFRDGIASESLFHGPLRFALNEKERLLYVSDPWNHVIRSVDLVKNTVNTIIGSPRGRRGNKDGIGREGALCIPRGLALDSISHFLYVADSNNNSIRKIILDENRIETLCGVEEQGHRDGTFEEAMFCNPTNLVWNAEMQELYVSDTWNHVIRVISLTNKTVSTLCGTPGIEGYKNGISTQAKFKFPQGLALDSHSQYLYVTDENYVVRRISLLEKAKVDTLCEKSYMKNCKNPSSLAFTFPSGIIYDPHSHSLYVMNQNGLKKIVFRNKF